MKIYIINGPNLNMLGVREPDIYGKASYKDLVILIDNYCKEHGTEAEFYQSNHEGDIVDFIQKAYYENVDGIVINPAAYTHTSVAIADAVKAVMLPVVEVHISDVEKRENFRQISYLTPHCIKRISGLGFEGYLRAVDAIMEKINE